MTLRVFSILFVLSILLVSLDFIDEPVTLSASAEVYTEDALQNMTHAQLLNASLNLSRELSDLYQVIIVLNGTINNLTQDIATLQGLLRNSSDQNDALWHTIGRMNVTIDIQNKTISYLENKRLEAEDDLNAIYDTLNINRELGDPGNDYLTYYDPLAINPNGPRGKWYQYWLSGYEEIEYDSSGNIHLYYGKAEFDEKLNRWYVTCNITEYIVAMNQHLEDTQRANILVTYAFPISFVILISFISLLFVYRRRRLAQDPYIGKNVHEDTDATLLSDYQPEDEEESL